jgi:hypothetical protein
VTIVGFETVLGVQSGRGSKFPCRRHGSYGMAAVVSKPLWRLPIVFYLKNIADIKVIDYIVSGTPCMINRCEARQVKS